ncbi:RagB/SusD family nutrient uptake outer membrane protein [Labilibacter marinus]|uniref:RagB/SusD family nutrient uptake outer membrane protein n=1 Tax=Labilibacter marinus TaxID=1477105 RepID=UPI00094F700E|nr:RagB/SusD family nutrient uptake outer membrane protein [Labilibacter marinus]
MKQNMFKYILIFLFIGGLTSCKDYLTEEDPNRLTTDSYWRNLRDTESGLTATYSTLLNHFIMNLDVEACRSDEGWPGYGRPAPNSGGVIDWYYKTYNSSDLNIGRKWNACYQGIFRANQVIAALKEIGSTEDNEELWNDQMAEARFLRGLFHYYLYWSFNNGEVIIRDELPIDLTTYNKGLSPAKTVRNFFIQDLYFAYDNLPAIYKGETSAKIGKATAGAAATILGNHYLYEANYDSASVYYADVIENKKYEYKLETAVEPGASCKMFSIYGENDSESIFEISYNLVHNPELSVWAEESMHNRWAVKTAGSGGPLCPAWVVYAFKSEALDPLDNRNYYDDPSVPSGRSLRNVSMRSSAMITCVEDTRTPWYGGEKSVAESEGFTPTGWGFGRCRKYTDHNLAESEGWMSGLNVTVNRLSEVYINLAECELHNGNVDNALSLINKVRARWGLVQLGISSNPSNTFDGVDYAAAPSLLMDHIMYVEKPLETYMEGFSTRWFDLRRWGITADRFKELSEQTYYAIDYTFKNSADKEVTKKSASIVKDVDPGYSGSAARVIDYEYDITADNFNSELHDYFPLPLAEQTGNSDID